MRLSRLIHRHEERTSPPVEADDAEAVKTERPQIPVEGLADTETPQHVTTEALKRQFEERFAARRRRRGPGT